MMDEIKAIDAAIQHEMARIVEHAERTLVPLLVLRADRDEIHRRAESAPTRRLHMEADAKAALSAKRDLTMGRSIVLDLLRATTRGRRHRYWIAEKLRSEGFGVQGVDAVLDAMIADGTLTKDAFDVHELNAADPRAAAASLNVRPAKSDRPASVRPPSGPAIPDAANSVLGKLDVSLLLILGEASEGIQYEAVKARLKQLGCDPPRIEFVAALRRFGRYNGIGSWFLGDAYADKTDKARSEPERSVERPIPKAGHSSRPSVRQPAGPVTSQARSDWKRARGDLLRDLSTADRAAAVTYRSLGPEATHALVTRRSAVP